MNRFLFPVVIEKDEEGYFASCPSLQGCYTQGNSYEEVLENIRDAILLHIEDRIANSEEIPKLSQIVASLAFTACEGHALDEVAVEECINAQNR